MEQNFKNEIRGITAAKILSRLSLILIILNRFIPILLGYGIDFLSLIWIFLCVTPCLFLVIYLTGLHSKMQLKSLFLSIFSWYAFMTFYEVIESLVCSYYFDIPYMIKMSSYIVAFILVLISFIKGFKSKPLTIIAIALIVFFSTISLFSDLILSLQSEDFEWFSLMNTYYIAEMSVFAALFVLLFKNVGRGEKTENKGNINYNNMPVETALKVLYDELCNGNITSEEYRNERSRIISKL